MKTLQGDITTEEFNKQLIENKLIEMLRSTGTLTLGHMDLIRTQVNKWYNLMLDNNMTIIDFLDCMDAVDRKSFSRFFKD